MTNLLLKINYHNKDTHLLFTSFIALSFAIHFSYEVQSFDLFIFSIYSLITITSLWGLFYSDKQNYSVHQTFCVFYYFFFGIAPLVQYQSQTNFYDTVMVLQKTYEQLGLLLLGILITYLVAFNKLKNKKISFPNKKFKTATPKIEFYYAFSLLGLFGFLFLSYFSLEYFFKQPPTGWQKLHTRYGLLGYSLLLVARTLPVISYLHYKLKFPKNTITHYLLLIITLVCCFPSSLSRSVTIAYYLPIFILNTSKIFKYKHTYGLLYLLGFYFVFPILNYFRAKNNTIILGTSLFTSGHLDAFHNFAQGYQMGYISYGKQFIGSILFFIPESIWNNRPIGTGQHIAEQLNFNHTNIAYPFFAEGFSNFGYLGILLFIVIIIALNLILHPNILQVCNNLELYNILQLYFLGYEFYLIRGDLYSSCKLAFSIALGLLLFYFYLKIYSYFIKNK